jgi:hypothetical protein
MVKRKRAAGGGRKPKGEFANLDSVFSIRMPAGLRAQLEHAAKHRGRSTSQEILRRLQNSFHVERHKGEPPHVRALCFLVAHIATRAAGPGPHEFSRRVRAAAEKVRRGESPAKVVTVSGNAALRPHDWRRDPYTFRVIKRAIVALLDKLQPSGEPRSNDEHKSPEDHGEEIANATWLLLKYANADDSDRVADAVLREFGARNWQIAGGDVPRIREMAKDVFERAAYGMGNARRDLQVGQDK